MNLPEIEHIKTHGCDCGRAHTCKLDDVIIGSGAIEKLPDAVRRYGAKKAFVISDINTYKAAGERACNILARAGIDRVNHVISETAPKPHEHTVGSLMLNFDTSCDILIAVGSGVINDCTKFLAAIGNLPFIVVATAPSMDGYASATSSMERDGLKVSIKTKNADIIIGDTDILKNAPMKMLWAGLGDIIAKYVALCDWRIASLVAGDYYCEAVADTVRTALKCCTDNAEGLAARDAAAVEAVFRAMVISGISMSFAGTSQPASGVEHSLSHIWDMRALEFGTPSELHGLQCAVGTFIGIKNYERIRSHTPCKEAALLKAAAFDYNAHAGKLRRFIGKGAEAMISLEARECKYDLKKHENHLDTIIGNWDEICRIIDEELPSYDELSALYRRIGAPITPEDIGIDTDTLPDVFAATRDIRDKYVQSRLMWDIGMDF